ncbi:MAG: hypothetical protein MI924_19255, partial [Chloroflexales bacterium]|nr:hypothetical protein [Chloroflexales bacterium]
RKYFPIDEASGCDTFSVRLRNQNGSGLTSFEDLLFGMKFPEELHGTRRIHAGIADIDCFANQLPKGANVRRSEMANSGLCRNTHGYSPLTNRQKDDICGGSSWPIAVELVNLRRLS